MSKNKFNKVNSYSSDSDEMKRMLKTLGVVVLILGVFYLWFAILNGEISFGSKEKEAEIQNVEIVAGDTFTRKDETYYVMMYDFDNERQASRYSNLYNVYYQKGGSVKIYVVDLNKKFNTRFITTDSSKVNISSIDSLKVVDGTLIKVEKGKGTLKVIGEEQIKKELLDK